MGCCLSVLGLWERVVGRTSWLHHIVGRPNLFAPWLCVELENWVHRMVYFCLVACFNGVWGVFLVSCAVFLSLCPISLCLPVSFASYFRLSVFLCVSLSCTNSSHTRKQEVASSCFSYAGWKHSPQSFYDPGSSTGW